MRGYVSEVGEDFAFVNSNGKRYYFRTKHFNYSVPVGTEVEFKILDRETAFNKRLMDGLEKDSDIGSFRNPKMPQGYRRNGKGQTAPEATDVRIIREKSGVGERA